MKSIIRNLLLFVAVLILSYITAPYFGSWYDKFSPQYGSWIVSKDYAVFVAGLPVAYVFFTPFLFELFGTVNKRKWILWLMIPPALMWIEADRYYLYIPIIVGLVGFFAAQIINLIIKKFRHPNPPMVVK